MELELVQGISIEKSFIKNIIKNQEYNKSVILDYYTRLQSEFIDVIEDDLCFRDDDLDIFIKRRKLIKQINFDNKIYNIDNCNALWLLDVYNEQKYKDFKKTNLCRDKFCNNCKKVKQSARLSKFMPLIDDLSKDKYLYHVVFTVPNCSGAYLHETIKKIFKNFYTLNRYLKLEKKIRGLDFEPYSYIGALRSLEVTFKKDDYHPHLHCILSFDKPLPSKKYIKNTYSVSKKNGKRKFTDFEILIQKIWYLLNNDIRVNQKSIDNLEVGYSCTIDPIDESSVHEVFKYMTKSTDEESNILTYENFKDLYFSLHGIRQIQGYGCFYNVKDDDSIIDQVDDIYDYFINRLRIKESPVESVEKPQDLLNDNEFKLISRKRIFHYLNSL